jgi:Ser/Thr protein kinase RdoA (MazF antagonist)
MRVPAQIDVIEIVRDLFGWVACSVRRFPEGLANYVFEATPLDGEADPLVVRLGRPEAAEEFHGAVAWSERLRPAGVPLPYLIASGRHGAFPYLVLERLPGDDLGHVYATLRTEEKRQLARELVRIQRVVRAQPPGRGCGFVVEPEGPFPHARWEDVVHATLAAARRDLESARVISPTIVDRVQAALRGFADHFASVPPRPFLDDTTTKNVIVHRGKLSGIVDVDAVCYGDPLYTVGLTRAALLTRGHDAAYVDFWCEELDLGPRERAVVHLYTAVFCVVFLSELGHAWNGAVPAPVSETYVARVIAVLDASLRSL